LEADAVEERSRNNSPADRRNRSTLTVTSILRLRRKSNIVVCGRLEIGDDRELPLGMPAEMNILTSPSQIAEIIQNTKTIAVLGIKPESHLSQPAFYVSKYMQNAGYKIIPVPVYYPDVTTILGEKVYRKLVDIPDEIDMVNVFRRPQDIPQHVDDIIAKRPKSVWFQLGIVNDEAAERLAEAGIKVVQDKCLMVEHRYL